MSAALKLIISKNGEDVQTLNLAEIKKDSLLLGRSDEADVKMDSRAIGRNHAIIHFAGTGISLEKRTQFGKLQVNGQDVKESPLKAGDVISIADYIVRLEEQTSLAQSAAEPVPAPAPAQAEASEQQIESQTKVQELNLEGAIPEEIAAPVDSPLETSPQAEEPYVETERTAMVSSSQIIVKLSFRPGEANVEEFEITKPEITIGRGSQCDVIIEDKKSSRQHAAIRKVGGNYVLKDLSSANGTYVNGIRVTEKELTGEDVIKIGSTEIRFLAINQDFFNQEQQGKFLSVTDDIPQLDGLAPESAIEAPVGISGDGLAALQSDLSNTAGLDSSNFISDPVAPPQPKSLVDKFKALPRQKQIIYGALIVLVVIMGWEWLDEQDAAEKAAQKKKAEQSQTKDPTEVAFAQLPKEKQEFVRQTYALAMDYFTKRNYEQALFEVNKIHEIANGFFYKDSKDIEMYAKKGIETLKAIQEEQKKKEEEEKRKQKIAELVALAQDYFDKGNESEAKEIFGKILELDPDNPTVARIKATIEEREQKKLAEEEQKRQIEKMKKAMSDIIAVGRDLFKDGKYYEAIDKLLEVSNAGTDSALLQEARDLIAQVKKELSDRRQPHLDAAKAAYEAREFDKARNEWKAALELDSKCEVCKDGIARVKHDVHERAQKIFIEAIIAESVSDLNMARKKYSDCYQASVPEDDYYGRCWRKYHRFITLEGQSESSATDSPEGGSGAGSGAVRAPAEAYKDGDPYTIEVLESL